MLFSLCSLHKQAYNSINLFIFTQGIYNAKHSSTGCFRHLVRSQSSVLFLEETGVASDIQRRALVALQSVYSNQNTVLQSSCDWGKKTSESLI